MRHGWLGVLALLVAAAGCGGDGNPLKGQWAAEDSEFECVLGAAFEQETYRFIYVCEHGDGSFGAQVEDGSYTYDSDSLWLTPERWSCSGLAEPPSHADARVGYNVEDGFLSLEFPSGLQTLERLDTEPTTADVPFGCYDEEGFFTPNPIGPV